MAWCGVYAVAMALVEAAVVVYLRALAPAEGPLSVLHTLLPPRILGVEMAREVATLVMLLAVAALAGRTGWERFLFLALAFGVWDIFYYVWLWVFIGWPPSLLTWDVLFLIPVPWLAPVLAPVIVSAGLVAASLWILSRGSGESGSTGGLPRLVWLAAAAGAALIVLSFTLDSTAVLVSGQPPDFRWPLFAGGGVLGVVALGLGTAKGGSRS